MMACVNGLLGIRVLCVSFSVKAALGAVFIERPEELSFFTFAVL